MAAQASDELWRMILALPARQRTQVAADVRATVADERDDGARTDEEQSLLAERMAEESDDAPSIPWEEAMRRAREAVARAGHGAANG